MRGNNRNNGQKGFTLIELLIVIAIIGILAAVLIPQLLGARNAAIVRAAQAHNSNVYTALHGHFAASPPATTNAQVITNMNASCMAAVVPSAATLEFGWRAPPAGVTACTAAVLGTNDFTVTTTGGGVTFINGVQQ